MTKFDSHNINAAHTQRELEQALADIHVEERRLGLSDVCAVREDAASSRQARINAAIEQDRLLFCERTKQWKERG